MTQPIFGPAGTADNMKKLGVKTSMDIPRVLSQMGLTAYEYQCGHGVSVSDETAAAFGEECRKYAITPSLHAPYFISLSSESEETREKSIGHILKSAAAVACMGGSRIVVHSGSCAKLSRKDALALACDTLMRAYERMKQEGTGGISICPETMGKINQLGDLDEVISLCLLDESFIPCIDFGHLNARTHGGLKTRADFAAVLDKICDKLGEDRLKNIHCHFSKIEYSSGGEKKHLTFEDTQFGPDFDFLAEEIYSRGLTPVIICESSGTQDTDAVTMARTYALLV